LENTVGIVGTFMGVVGRAKIEAIEWVVVKAGGITGTVIVGVVDKLSIVFTTFG
jgi:hypothetical protein